MLPVTVIVVTYNSADVIRDCLSSVMDVARVIVVDNNSQDNTCAIIAQHFPHVECIKSKENSGFGQANNKALEKVTTPFALLLNPDAVMQSESYSILLRAADHYPDAAILSPQLLSDKGEVQRSYKPTVFERDNIRSTHMPLAEGDVCAGFLSGAVMLLRMEYIRQVGFFDPKIFLYYEDDDLCIRVRKAGYGLVWVQEAEAVHLCGQSSPSTRSSLYWKNWHLTWSRLYLEKKYHGNRKACRLSLKLLMLYGIKIVSYAIIINKPKMIRSYSRMAAAKSFVIDQFLGRLL